MKRTKNGLEYNVFTKVDKSWDEYDKLVAKGQISRYKKCFFDKNNMVIEEESDIQDILDNERN